MIREEIGLAEWVNYTVEFVGVKAKTEVFIKLIEI